MHSHYLALYNLLSNDLIVGSISFFSDICGACGVKIREKYLLRVDEQSWHLQCLRCCICDSSLEDHKTCYNKEGNFYCKLDYYRKFGAKCSKCFRVIQSNDWVRRASSQVYHLACFACDNCKRQLSTGEEFALQESDVLCKTHYVEQIEGGDHKDSELAQKAKAKRVRTTFTEEQIQVLQANFNLDSNPDGQDLERIAHITGLSKRVTQVWFQNSRARQKKQQLQQGASSDSMPSPKVATSGEIHQIARTAAISSHSQTDHSLHPTLPLPLVTTGMYGRRETNIH
ncbi:hypothetical protein ACJMK2_038741 [Sinanodonta woodiana]|uniref:LIM/homeobox protein Awh n=1 Tax=Sinanodonta woodiana TaxID=1069815 RepID=A0ABD3WD99_SINWO